MRSAVPCHCASSGGGVPTPSHPRPVQGLKPTPFATADCSLQLVVSSVQIPTAMISHAIVLSAASERRASAASVVCVRRAEGLGFLHRAPGIAEGEELLLNYRLSEPFPGRQGKAGRRYRHFSCRSLFKCR